MVFKSTFVYVNLTALDCIDLWKASTSAECAAKTINFFLPKIVNMCHYTLEICKSSVRVLICWSLILNMFNLHKIGEICGVFGHRPISLVSA